MREQDTFLFDGTEYEPTQIRENRERNRVITAETLQDYSNRTLEVVFDTLALPINDHDIGEWYSIYYHSCGKRLDRKLVFEQVYEDPSGYVYVFDARGEQTCVERDTG